MLVSHHAALSAVATLMLAPHIRKKHELALFWAAAVGQDVDHYLWFAARYRNPSLRDAYRFFRTRYGLPRRPDAELEGNPRPLHGLLPLTLAVAATAVERRLWPIAAGMAFHGLLDAVREYAVPDDFAKRADQSDSQEEYSGGLRERAATRTNGHPVQEAASHRRDAGRGDRVANVRHAGETEAEASKGNDSERLAPAGRAR